MIKRFKKSTYKLSALAMTVLVLVGGGLLTEAKANEIKIIDTNDTNVESQVIDGRIVDKIDLPFVNDDEVIGTWETVDFVKKDEDFNTQIKQWKDDLYLKKLVFLPEGKMTQPNSDDLTTVSWLTWTKGLMIHKGDKTASEYTIKEINGERYMFLQWKNGDYFLRGVKPYYYVLKEVK